jgi:cell division protein FtsN
VVQSRPLAHQEQDDAFREIQLNGKQLVFLFMVATVVSVVIFLCGVFVGRGVRAERAPLVADSSASTPVTTPDAAAAEAPPPTPPGSDPTNAAPPPAVDELSYFNRLGKPGKEQEEVKSPPQDSPVRAGKSAQVEHQDAAPAPTPAVSAKAVPPPAPTPAAPASTPPAPAPPAKDTGTTAAAASTPGPEPSGSGFALQVTALRERGEAEAIAKRLSSKGYAAYVLTPVTGSPSVFRVRIGKFKTRREAEAIATRLQREEQLTPWITR